VKKKIIILGSTGSIGKNTIEIIRKDKKNFKIELLSTNRNILSVVNQAKEFNVKNVIINDYNSFLNAKSMFSDLGINFYNSFSIIEKLFKKKTIDYSMVSLVGIDGLYPTITIVKISKYVAIANKESIICGWFFIRKALQRFKTSFIPVDSEHFSIHSILKNNNDLIDHVIITASGGPFLNLKKKKFKKIKMKDALKHPNWKMGEKITIDSSTMMNKVFEVIEAKKIFNLKYKNISILTHPKSYVHSIIQFKNSLTKILIHEPDMKIPIFNSLYPNSIPKLSLKKINLDILNNLYLKNVNKKKFPLVKILDHLSDNDSLYETALVTINDFFVKKFLEGKIDYLKLIFYIKNNSEKKDFIKFKKIFPKNISQIYDTRDYVNYKLDFLDI